MARKNYTAEQIIGMLREAEVRLSEGEEPGAICRGLGISEQNYYRWRREALGFGGIFSASFPLWPSCGLPRK